MKEELAKINKLLDGNDVEDTYEIRKLFIKCFIWHDYRKGPRKVKTIRCGSIPFEDTPKSLYRLLYLLDSVETIDFSDMFKSGTLVEVCSPCYNFCCSFQFYKYQLAGYFHCSEQNIKGKEYCVTSGIPGRNNGVNCGSELGNIWFNTLIKCLNHEFEVYPGNDFKV